MEDFVRALLLMANQHQANADEYAMLVDNSSDHGPFGFLNKEWRKTAAEQQGLADVYSQFAYDVAMLEALPLSR